MRFTQVLRAEATADDATIHLLGEDNQRYAVTLTADAVREAMSALVEASARLRYKNQVPEHGLAYHLKGCREFAVGGEQGLGLVTTVGFEIGLIVDSQTLAVLRMCIDRIESDIKHDGPIH